METTKILINSVISTPNARFLTVDIKNFYLNTPMQRYEYIRIPLTLLPTDIITEYNLTAISHNGFVVTKVQKGMYGLPQAGCLAYNQLVSHLDKHNYYPDRTTAGLFHHRTKTIKFCLVINNFGVKYTNTNDAHHLLTTLKQKYKIVVDWKGTTFCGVHLDWNYTNKHVTLSLPNYVEATLRRFNHSAPLTQEAAPNLGLRPNVPPDHNLQQQLHQTT